MKRMRRQQEWFHTIVRSSQLHQICLWIATASTAAVCRPRQLYALSVEHSMNGRAHLSTHAALYLSGVAGRCSMFMRGEGKCTAVKRMARVNDVSRECMRRRETLEIRYRGSAVLSTDGRPTARRVRVLHVIRESRGALHRFFRDRGHSVSSATDDTNARNRLAVPSGSAQSHGAAFGVWRSRESARGNALRWASTQLRRGLHPAKSRALDPRQDLDIIT